MSMLSFVTLTQTIHFSCSVEVWCAYKLPMTSSLSTFPQRGVTPAKRLQKFNTSKITSQSDFLHPPHPSQPFFPSPRPRSHPPQCLSFCLFKLPILPHLKTRLSYVRQRLLHLGDILLPSTGHKPLPLALQALMVVPLLETRHDEEVRGSTAQNGFDDVAAAVGDGVGAAHSCCIPGSGLG